MEYAKLFYSGRYPRPEKRMDMIILFKEFLQKIWWETSTSEEKAKQYMKQELEYQKERKTQLSLSLTNLNLDEESREYISRRPETPKSKFW